MDASCSNVEPHALMLSPFETAPREIRDMIYEYCLLHHEEILPFPADYNRKANMEAGVQSALTVGGHKELDGKLADFRYSTHWPCIALLGVNKKIHGKAAETLFGTNTWRFTCQELEIFITDRRACFGLWARYDQYIRRVSLHLSMFDVPSEDVLHHARVWRHRSKGEENP